MAQVAGNCGHPQCPLQHPPVVRPLPEAVRQQLADAFAEQSQSDFRIFENSLEDVEECHRLHFLQMACEKIAKAYRLRDIALLEEAELYSHVAFTKFIQTILKSPQIKELYTSSDGRRQKRRRNMERYARPLAEKIEKLAPAVDRGQTPANVEYPWVEGESVYIPCRYPFSHLNLRGYDEKEFLKLLKTVIYNYEQIVLNG